MSKWLAIELGSQPGRIALGEDERVLETDCLEGHRHSEGLLPAVGDLLSRQGWTLRQVEALYGSSGPGGFTGMRVALATLKGFARGLNLPIHLVGSAEARVLVWSEETGQSGPVWVVTPAGSRRFSITEFNEALEQEKQTLTETLPESVPENLVILMDDGTTGKIPSSWQGRVTCRNLRAEDLKRVADRASTTETAATPHEAIALSPRYFALTYRKWEPKGPAPTCADAAATLRCPQGTSTGAQTPPTQD